MSPLRTRKRNPARVSRALFYQATQTRHVCVLLSRQASHRCKITRRPVRRSMARSRENRRVNWLFPSTTEYVRSQCDSSRRRRGVCAGARGSVRERGRAWSTQATYARFTKRNAALGAQAAHATAQRRRLTRRGATGLPAVSAADSGPMNGVEREVRASCRSEASHSSGAGAGSSM